MKRVELEIVMDNSQYVNSAKQVEQATQSMSDSQKKHYSSTKGLIEQEIEDIRELQRARSKARNVQEIAGYNKAIESAKKNLKEYNEAGVKFEKAQKEQVKSTNGLFSAFKKLLGPVLTVTAAIKGFNVIMNSTQKTGDLLKREVTAVKTALGELWRSIASGNLDELGKRMKEAAAAGREYARSMDLVGDRERELQIRESERKIQLAELAKVYRNTALVGEEGYKKRRDAAEEYIRLTEEGEREAIELAELRLAAELKQASVISGLTEDEIKNNLLRAQSLEDNGKAVEDYINLQKQLKTELEKTTFEVSTEGVRIPTGLGGDPEKIKEYRAAIAAVSPEIIELARQMKGWNELTDENRKKITDAIVAVNDAKSKAVNSTIRANTMMELSDRQLAEGTKKNNEELLKLREQFAKELLQLQDTYEQSQIDQLEGTEKIEAERQYQLRQISLLRVHLESMGTLTEDHYRMLAALEENINNEALKKELDYRDEQLQAMVEYGAEVRELERQLQEESLDLLEDNEEAKLRLRIKFAEEDIKIIEQSGRLTSAVEIAILKQRIELWKKEIEKASQEEGGFSLWDLLDPNGEMSEGERGDAERATQELVGTFVSMFDEMYDARVRDAERTRSLIEEQLDFTQRGLEAEMELMKAGYANNVDAKRKELEELKKQREIALREEQKAIKAQQQFDTVMQLSSLITSSANIFKGFSSIPVVGVPLAIAAIAAMFAAFAATKARAASAVKLAEGGYGDATGVVTGRTHRQGGERFTDHIEVERGEMFGVLNRRATQKYGHQFGEIVTNFNRDAVTYERTPDIRNIIDMNQANDRLDRVEGQLIKLNRHFASQAEVVDTGSMRIIKKGYKTRIIRK